MMLHCFLLLKSSKNDPKHFFRFVSCSKIILTVEHKIILNLLNESSDSKFVTRKWNNSNNQSDTNYDAANEIIYNTEVLQSNFYDYNDA